MSGVWGRERDHDQGRTDVDILTPRYALPDCPPYAFASQVFSVMFAHGGGVDASEASFDSQIDELGGSLLLPGCAIHHPGHLQTRLVAILTDWWT